MSWPKSRPDGGAKSPARYKGRANGFGPTRTTWA